MLRRNECIHILDRVEQFPILLPVTCFAERDSLKYALSVARCTRNRRADIHYVTGVLIHLTHCEMQALVGLTTDQEQREEKASETCFRAYKINVVSNIR